MYTVFISESNYAFLINSLFIQLGVSMKKVIIIIAIAAAAISAYSQEKDAVAEMATFASTCQVQHANGYEGTADCKGRVAVVTKANTVQCVPRAALVNKEGQWMVFKSPKEIDIVTPCKNGMKVKS